MQRGHSENPYEQAWADSRFLQYDENNGFDIYECNVTNFYNTNYTNEDSSYIYMTGYIDSLRCWELKMDLLARIRLELFTTCSEVRM